MRALHTLPGSLSGPANQRWKWAGFWLLAWAPLLATPAWGQVVFSEDFEGLTLGPFVSSSETGGDGTDWSADPPTGWVRDNTTTPVGGPIEFFGFTFMTLDAWNATAGQTRADFTRAQGTLMVADGDEYDDDAGNGSVLGESSQAMNVFIQTPSTSFSVSPGSLFLAWDNDFRAFDNSTGTIDVSFDGGSTFENVYSIVGADERNIRKQLSLNNPATGNLVLKFGYTNADNDWWWAVDNIEVSGTLPQLDVAVDRDTGAITLTNRTGAAVNFSGYSITSAVGALDPTDWLSIADNYDADGDQSVDSVHVWTALTQSGTFGDLSEGDLDSGAGTTLAPGQQIDLGTPFINSPFSSDLIFQYISGGEVVTGLLDYQGAAATLIADFDLDNDLDSDDWMIFRDNQHADLSGTTTLQAYFQGDLNSDGANNHADFQLFRSAFEAANGDGSFADMLRNIPEPSSCWLAAAGALLGAPRRRREASRRTGASR